MTIAPKQVADFGDNVIDAILEMIDAEPDPELQRTLLQRAHRKDWLYQRFAGDPSNPLDGGRVVVTFEGLREYVIPLVRVYARWTDA